MQQLHQSPLTANRIRAEVLACLGLMAAPCACDQHHAIHRICNPVSPVQPETIAQQCTTGCAMVVPRSLLHQIQTMHKGCKVRISCHCPRMEKQHTVLVCKNRFAQPALLTAAASLLDHAFVTHVFVLSACACIRICEWLKCLDMLMCTIPCTQPSITNLTELQHCAIILGLGCSALWMTAGRSIGSASSTT